MLFRNEQGIQCLLQKNPKRASEIFQEKHLSQKNLRQIRRKHEWYSVFSGEFHTKSTRDNMSFSLKSRSAASNKSITYI